MSELPRIQPTAPAQPIQPLRPSRETGREPRRPPQHDKRRPTHGEADADAPEPESGSHPAPDDAAGRAAREEDEAPRPTHIDLRV